MEIDILLYFEEYCEIDIQLFCWEEKVNIRYIIMTPSNLFERFEDYYADYGLEKVRVFSIGSLAPFHYLTFYSFLKSNLRRSVDKYIVTKNYNETEIETLLMFSENRLTTLHKVNYLYNDITTYILSSHYFEVFHIPTEMLLYMEDCFLWNHIII